MKKLFTAFLLILSLALTGCGQDVPVPRSNARLSVVTDNIAAYDWAQNIIGDEPVELTVLGANGADMHSYQPLARDFATLADCDLFIYIGGESDSWAEDALQDTTNGAYALPLISLLGERAQMEHITPEMTADGHNHDADADLEMDEHIWLSLKNAEICVNKIAEQLAKLDTDGAATYRANARAYCEKLAELDTAYQTAVTNADFGTILVADRFPFIYLAEDYHINWFAAYPGCSAETGASFETVLTLTDTLKSYQLPAVIICEKSDDTLAKSIISGAGLADTDIIELNSMQAVSLADLQSGSTYLKIMQDNLAALNSALNNTYEY